MNYVYIAENTFPVPFLSDLTKLSSSLEDKHSSPPSSHLMLIFIPIICNLPLGGYGIRWNSEFIPDICLKMKLGNHENYFWNARGWFEPNPL